MLIKQKKWTNLRKVQPFKTEPGKKRLNQEEIENINRSITSTEIKPVTKNFSIIKCPEPDDFTDKFHQMFTEELTTLILLKLFPKTTEGGTLPNSICEATIT